MAPTLRDLRRQRALSQRALAASAGEALHQVKVHRFESGQALPTWTEAKALGSVLGASPGHVIDLAERAQRDRARLEGEVRAALDAGGDLTERMRRLAAAIHEVRSDYPSLALDLAAEIGAALASIADLMEDAMTHHRSAKR